MAVVSIPNDLVIEPPATTLVVPISIDDATGLQAFDILLTYNSAVLDLVDVELGDLAASEGFGLTDNPNEPGGTLSLSAFRVDPLAAGSGVLINLTFNVAPGVTNGASELDLLDFIFNEIPSTDAGVELQDGLVTIGTGSGGTDAPPTVVEPLRDIEVFENSSNLEIDLANVFTDVDNDDGAIIKVVTNNDNPTLLTAVIAGDTLTLDFLVDQTGAANITVQGSSNGLTVEDTFTVLVNPVDDSLRLENPIADVTVDEDAPNQVINLANVFVDPDGDSGAIAKAIQTNTNPALVTTTLDGNTLTLDFADNASGTAEITVVGSVGEEAVTDIFIVTVSAVDDGPVVVVPLEDLSVAVNAPNQVIDLSDTFGDVDSDDSAIVISVQNNTNPTLIATTLQNDTLTLDFLGNLVGTADITLRATSNGLTLDETFTVNVSSPTGPKVTRFFNTDLGGHFYTDSPDEVAFVEANLPQLRNEGERFFGVGEGASGAQPVRRFFNTDVGSHFFTIFQDEIDFIEANLPQLRDEGDRFLAFSSLEDAAARPADAIPVYSFFNNDLGSHFFTTGEEERLFVEANLPQLTPVGPGGIAFYVLPCDDTCVI